MSVQTEYKITDLLPTSVPMVVTETQLLPYSIPFRQNWVTSSFRLSHRKGFLIKLVINEHETVFGECAPMTEIGTESFSEAQTFLQIHLKSIQGKKLDENCLNQADAFPSCRFALETASLSLLDQFNKQPFYERLNPDYSRIIKTNIMLGALDDSILERTKEAEQEGFSCLKIKVGINNINEELNWLHKLIKSIQPKTRIRLDANKSWTMDQTEYLLEQLKKLKLESFIDCIEEPLQQFDQKAYSYLQRNTCIPLALDESFLTNSSLHDYPVKRLVLKPMALGGVLKTWKLAQQAKKYKITTVITSSIESGYGLWPITYLCTALDNDQFHGLATANWLSDPLIQPPEIQHGCIHL